MPNICHNTLEISGSLQYVTTFMSVLKGGENTPLCNPLIPAPNNAERSWFEENWFGREAIVRSDWKATENNSYMIDFDSAWSPPYDFILKVSKTYSDITFKLTWSVYEMLWCGCVSITNGETSDFINYKFGEKDQDNLTEDYGKKIFGDILNEINNHLQISTFVNATGKPRVRRVLRNQ